MPTLTWRACLLIVVLVGGSTAGRAQPSAADTPFCEEPSRRQTVDTRGLGAFYCTSRSVATGPLRAAHATARPMFYGAVPAAWLGAALRDDGYPAAYRLTLAQGATYGLVLGLKHAVGRPRPYVRRALTSRSRHYGPSQGEKYQAFPSGHAALSAALATSWSLSYPEWYVVGAGAAWAAGVSLSRLYLGVHYPSDVVVGAAIGVGVAVLVHRARGALTPSRLRANGAPEPAPSPLSVRIRF
jgi:membrane-associated phospholipid phosphatase